MKRFGMTTAVLFACTAILPLALAAKGNYTTKTGDLRIPKAEVTTEVRFFPYTAPDRTYMEVIAVRAPDGTIRTAFNTCQVCYNSGRGWYTVEGDSLVCNNCGNRFRTSQLELVKGGCNPVPITKDLKSEDSESITVSRDLLEQAKFLFLKWKKR
jgi:uncharacterized membrane protein